MDKIYDICCGIDVHKKLIVACLNHKRKKELREFGATTRELMELAEWLQKTTVRSLRWKAPVLPGNHCITSWNPMIFMRL